MKKSKREFTAPETKRAILLCETHGASSALQSPDPFHDNEYGVVFKGEFESQSEYVLLDVVVLFHLVLVFWSP